MSIESITSAAQSSGTSGTALKSLANDLDSFLMILTTQLQNQDPLSPMDSNEFTNQLVEFANVEQSINQTKSLEELIALQKTSDLTNAVNYMGKEVKVDHNEFTHSAGNERTLEYTLSEEAAAAGIFIFNESGNVVYSAPVEKKAGTHSVTWDGLDGVGNPLPSGKYHFEISAMNSNSQPLEDISYAYVGPVTAVEYGETGTTLTIGDVAVDIGKILAVHQPTPSSTASGQTNTPDSETPDETDDTATDDTATDETNTDEGSGDGNTDQASTDDTTTT